MRSTRPIDTRKFVEKYLEHDTEAMRGLIASFLNEVMLVEQEEQAGAGHYKRGVRRTARRNGFKPRGLVTRYGPIQANKPQLREKPFETRVFDRYSRAEKAVVGVISESYEQGVSTRKMQRVLAKLDVTVSRSEVSKINEQLDITVKEFMDRPLEETRYVFVDATYVHVRENGRYVTKALFLAMGVTARGYKQVLGARIMGREDESWWTMFFEDLKARGLHGVELVISDGHKGIKRAVERCFMGASWQLCHVHFRRNILKTIPMKERRMVNDLIKESMESPHLLSNLTLDLEKKGYTRACQLIEKHVQDLFNYMAFPQHQWIKLRTTNTLENINSMLKKRIKPIGAFPSDQSVLRVAISILTDINEEWITDKKHIDLERDTIMDTTG